MSKRFISRLSIFLLSSLMVIQSCQTPNNTLISTNNEIPNYKKLTFSTKYLSDIENSPVFQSVSGGAASDRSGIFSASTTFNDTRLNSADSKRFSLKFIRSNTSLYTEKITGADLAFSFLYSELKPAESENTFRKFEHEMSINVHLDVDNSINTRGVHLKGTVPISNINQPEIGSSQPNIGNFISGNYQDLFACYWGSEDFHAIYTPTDGVKVSIVDGKVMVNIPSVSQSFTGQYNTTNCGGTNGYVFPGGNLTSGNISFTVDAIVSPDPTPTPTPYPTATPTIFPTPDPSPYPEPEDDCEYISFSIKSNDDEELRIKDIDYLIDDIDIILEAYDEGRLNSLFEGEINLFNIQGKIPKVKLGDIKKLINASKSLINKALKLDTSDSEKIIKDNLIELSRLRTELAKIKSLKANSESCKAIYKNLPFKSAEIPNTLLSDLKKLAGEASYKKFIRALEKGIVPPTGRSGIKALKPSYQDYTYELKIGNSAGRILGKIDGNGTLTFDKFIPKGLH